MSEIWQTFVALMQTPGVPLRLGVMLATAVILGYLIYDDYRDAGKWLLASLVFVVFLGWLRYAIFETIETHHNLLMPPALDITGLIAFGAGMSVGVYIARLARLRRAKADQAVEDVVEEITTKIKLNGGMKDGPQHC